VTLKASTWGRIRQFAVIGLRIRVRIMIVLQESRKTIMIRRGPSVPSARMTCGNGRWEPGRTHGMSHTTAAYAMSLGWRSSVSQRDCGEAVPSDGLAQLATVTSTRRTC